MAAFGDSTSKKSSKSAYDFRFADEEDVDDILSVVSESYKAEVGAHRTSEPLLLSEEVESDLRAATVRWVLLETPRPEEAVVACARLCFETSKNVKFGKTCSVSTLAAVGGTDERKQVRYHYLLHKMESVAQAQGAETLLVHVPMWREGESLWLSSKGYSDVGGDPWPTAKASQVNVPAVIIAHKKSLCVAPVVPTSDVARAAPTASNVTTTTTKIDLDLNSLSLVQDGAAPIELGGAGSTGGSGMESLMTDLFAALHAEQPKSSNPV